MRGCQRLYVPFVRRICGGRLCLEIRWEPPQQPKKRGGKSSLRAQYRGGTKSGSSVLIPILTRLNAQRRFPINEVQHTVVERPTILTQARFKNAERKLTLPIVMALSFVCVAPGSRRGSLPGLISRIWFDPQQPTAHSVRAQPHSSRPATHQPIVYAPNRRAPLIHCGHMDPTPWNEAAHFCMRPASASSLQTSHTSIWRCASRPKISSRSY